jgi:nucleoside-diphosphate-sugar epimerase
MDQKILITGSSGLVGTALVSALSARGVEVICLDIAAQGSSCGDVRDNERVERAIASVTGIIHLAAVSRVVWGEREPERCWATNVGGLRNVLHAAAASPLRPWVTFASSREVYGQPDSLPASEESPLRPVNIYGRSKLEGEKLVEAARCDGLRACTIRLSNVFGSTADHVDRVVPAFARAAAFGRELRVDGAEHTFDFTYIDDVARGIVLLAELLGSGGAVPPPLHFVTGVPTTLGELARMAIRVAGTDSSIRLAPPRNFDVARFFGCPDRVRTLLGWEPRVPIEEGLTRLILAFRDLPSADGREETTP